MTYLSINRQCYIDWVFLFSVAKTFNIFSFLFFFFFSLFVFLGPHRRQMDVSRVGALLQLWPPAFATDTATPDPSCICSLHHSLQQCWILNPLSKARDWTSDLMVPSWIHFCCALTGTSSSLFFFFWHLIFFQLSLPSKSRRMFCVVQVVI